MVQYRVQARGGGGVPAGELSLDLLREDESVETAQHLAALERKVGQLTKELDPLKRALPGIPGQWRDSG
ncbi:MAG: hypothetical protein H7305_03815 [Gemmatimonadaceae bacterium]|nr:hypothetical protein [Gemmatimonadaceae bacterium]